MLDINLIKWEKGTHYFFEFFQTTENRVKRWIENERCKTIIDKKIILNMFDIKKPVQIKNAENIVLKKFDKVVLWSDDGRYYILEMIGCEHTP